MGENAGSAFDQCPPEHKVPDRPPDKKRRAGSVAAEHGSNRKTKASSSSRKVSSKRPQGAQESDRDFSVYDGTTRVGNITAAGSEFIVVLPDGALLGSFKTLRQASAAISTAQGGVR
jgi:hypothetical protein